MFSVFSPVLNAGYGPKRSQTSGLVSRKPYAVEDFSVKQTDFSIKQSEENVVKKT